MYKQKRHRFVFYLLLSFLFSPIHISISFCAVVLLHPFSISIFRIISLGTTYTLYSMSPSTFLPTHLLFIPHTFNSHLLILLRYVLQVFFSSNYEIRFCLFYLNTIPFIFIMFIFVLFLLTISS